MLTSELLDSPLPLADSSMHSGSASSSTSKPAPEVA
jgi:hypothetical protein